MARDFTLEKYEELLRCALDNGYTVCTVVGYLTRSESDDRKCLVLRHDVDRALGRTMQLAKLEHRLGVHSTYYFRMTRQVFKPDAIGEIARMGHEVGYHYEVLDKTKGDSAAAGVLFGQELKEFRQIADVKTCAMHGNPLTRWDNRDLWKRCALQDFDLLGEAYLSFHDIVYLSDTGRTWSSRNKVKDWMPDADAARMPRIDVHSTDDLVRWLSGYESGSVYLTAHPERWVVGFPGWMVSRVRDGTVNGVKCALTRPRVGPENPQAARGGG